MQATLQKSIGGSLLSDEIGVKARYEFANKAAFTARTSFRNQSPDFNFQLYKSDYQSYNWYNPDLENQKTTTFLCKSRTPLVRKSLCTLATTQLITPITTQLLFRPGYEDPNVNKESIHLQTPQMIFI